MILHRFPAGVGRVLCYIAHMRSCNIIRAVGGVGLLFGLNAGAATDPLGKYRLILDRELLGVESRETPTISEPEPSPTAPSWARDYRMTMMTQDQDNGKVRVGLQHRRESSAILLIENDTSYPDFELVVADYQRGTARVRYQGNEHLFELEDGPAGEATSGSASGGNRMETLSGRQLRSPRTPSVPSPPPTPAPPSRREMEEYEEEKERVRRFNSEEMEAHLNQQQMEAIRSGKPPLPIPLTQEMDDQLVREGVLPLLEN